MAEKNTSKLSPFEKQQAEAAIKLIKEYRVLPLEGDDTDARFLSNPLNQKDIQLEISDSVYENISKYGVDPLYGARPMKRIVQKTVENLVAKFMLSGQVDSGATMRVTKEMIEGELSNTGV